MKRIAFVTAWLLSLVACVSFVAAKPAAVANVSDASTTDATSRHHLGVSFVEAGVDSGTIGPTNLLTFTFTSPVAQPFGDPSITAVEIRFIYMDLVAGQVLVTYDGVGDVFQRQRTVAISLSAANELAFTNAVKNAIAAQIGATFQ